MRGSIAFIVVAAATCQANAQEAVPPPTPPQIVLRVEQPAYTGMPIWLHLIVRDACLEHSKLPNAYADSYLWLRDDGAEVMRAGDQRVNGPMAQRTPFTEVKPRAFAPRPGFDDGVVSGMSTYSRLPGLLPCRWGSAAAPERIRQPEQDHIFALNGAYVFDQPGRYVVRWTTSQGNGFDMRTGQPLRDRVLDVTSSWVTFDVQPSTPEQRETWLKDMLQEGPEGDDTQIATDYIPALLAAWQDRRVTHKLLDLMCGTSKTVSAAADWALEYDLDGEAVSYFADLVGKGCLPDDNTMEHFALRHAAELVAVRARLLHGFATHLGGHWAADNVLAQAIGAMQVIRNDVAAPADDPHPDAWADDQVARASAILFKPQPPTCTATDSQRAGENVISYFSGKNVPPAGRDVLRTMITSSNDPILYWGAFGALMEMQNPDDLDILGKALMDVTFVGHENYEIDVHAIAVLFKARAIPTLIDVARHAKSAELRDAAAGELAAMDQPDGVSVLDAALHNQNPIERGLAARKLNWLVFHKIPLGPLAHYCPATTEADPCNAATLLPRSQLPRLRH